jgi:Homeodomain-like domain
MSEISQVWTTEPIRWPDRWRGPWELVLSWAIVKGRFECVGLALNPIGPGEPAAPLTARTLRRLKLGEFVDEERPNAKRAILRWIEDEEEPLWPETRPGLDPFTGMPVPDRPFFTDPKRVARRRRVVRRKRARSEFEAIEATEGTKGGRTKLTSEHLAQVAAVYADAYATGDPTQAVADRWHVTKSTAAKWLTRAREEGLLGAAIHGKTGGIP